MRARQVAVAHRHAVVAEGIIAGLARYPQIAPLAAVTSADECLSVGRRADAVVIDHYLPSMKTASQRLRRMGVRVVLLGGPRDETARVPLESSIGGLARTLVPELAQRRASDRGLTARQQEILALVARGYAAKQVARSLGISAKTVEMHKSRIFAKLGVSNQAAAAALAPAHTGVGLPTSPSSGRSE